MPETAHRPASYWERHTVPSGLGRSRLEQLARSVVHEGERDRFEVPVPFTQEALGEALTCTPDDVRAAAARGRKAQGEWAKAPLGERRRVLLRFHHLLLERQREVLDLIQLESGKARRYALEEVFDTALVARHYAIHGARYLRTKRHRGALPLLTKAWEYRHPVGVVGFITPWNFPLILSITDLLPALFAGNAAVLRPDVQSPFTALWAANLLAEAGLPQDVLTVVTGRGSTLGPVLAKEADYLMFTGSTRTGKLVAGMAAERLLGCSLELGGKNSMIVLDDAPLAKTVDGLIRGAFTGTGQVCVSMERAWIPARQFDQFAECVAERVRAMRLSPELAFGVDMGSLTLPSQLQAVRAHIDDAIGKGARILAGGKPRPDIGPLFHEPTVLAGVTPEMRVYAEETFGPVISLYPYTSIDEVVQRANDTAYGLNASVWSRSAGRAREVAVRIRAGSVNINEIYATSWTATAAPTGGMKESGIGRRHGEEGILKYTEAQTVAVQRILPLAPPSFLEESRYARLMTLLLRIIRFVPGLR